MPDFTTVKQIIYPMEWCSSFNPSSSVWLKWMLLDPGCLHACLYTVSLFFDHVLGPSSEAASRYHLYRTVKALRDRVDHVDEALTDSTASVIMSLLMIAECFGDYASVATHIQGLRRIVEMRGGIESFMQNEELYYKLCR